VKGEKSEKGMKGEKSEKGMKGEKSEKGVKSASGLMAGVRRMKAFLLPPCPACAGVRRKGLP